MSKKQKFKKLRIILGDQLNENHSWFKTVDDQVLYTLMEIRPESEYVTHHIQKIVGIFSGMRILKEQLVSQGHHVFYFKINDEINKHTFKENIEFLINSFSIETVEYQEPDEYRLDQIFRSLEESLGLPFRSFSSEHFLTNRFDVQEFFKGKKTFLMESFYRFMRKKWGVLMEDEKPFGNRWNYDQENRKKLPKKHIVPTPYLFDHDVSEVFSDIIRAELPYIGEIDPQHFMWPLNRKEAFKLFQYFLDFLLIDFGKYQDALTDDYWSLFHSRISFALNLKMIHPEEIIRKVEQHYELNPEIDLSSVEGFIRQILGWREYMRGIYWDQMPEYESKNYFNNTNKLPEFYWTGKTKMNCLSKAINQSLKYGYAHHIQRLMITGNFALLAGVHPDEVDEWYLGIYLDAFQWVEITNTRGMSQFADGGIVATKPYISSASYIKKMGDHCDQCKYDHKKKTGENACPFNSLYWNFIDQHESKLSTNNRMSMMLNLWKKMDTQKKEALLGQAAHYLEHIEEL